MIGAGVHIFVQSYSPYGKVRYVAIKTYNSTSGVTILLSLINESLQTSLNVS